MNFKKFSKKAVFILTAILMTTFMSLMGQNNNLETIQIDTAGMQPYTATALGGVQTSLFSMPETLDNTDFQKLIVDANITNLRFPGGTESNFLEPWEGDDERVTFTARYRQNTPYFIGKPLEKKYTYNEVYDFFDSVGADDITWVLDVAHHTPEQIRMLTDSWETNNRPVTRIEFGNELYYSNWIDSPSIPDKNKNGTIADEYLEKSSAALKEIRKGTFQGKAGVIFPKPNVQGINGSEDNFYGEDHYKTGWMDYFVNEADLSEFDAIIIHIYNGLIPPATAEQVYYYDSQWLADQISVAKAWFPDKEIWITEHNMAYFYDRTPNDYFNTFFHAVYLLRELAVFTEYGVSVSNQHTLAGYAYEMIGPSNGFLNAYSHDAEVLRRASYFPVYLYNRAKIDALTYKTSAMDTEFGYIMFAYPDGIRLLWWSIDGSTDKEIIIDGYTFAAGESIMGNIEDTSEESANGSFQKSQEWYPPWFENLKPEAQDCAVISGQGIGIMDFKKR